MREAGQLVVGTAGHIDHGKSRLVLALTGTDPDRLPEEKARGMTIDLGFAHLRFAEADIWFVDVPGHERFIRNMVAGATGIDAALLVVAADDSVMPQTREHAELLALLGVERVVLVLTKIDLVDDEWAAAVEDEARALLAGVGLSPLAAVRTSAETGAGLDELRTLLGRLAREGGAAAAGATWFRLPIDRAFNVAGRGTVVTGSVAHGAVQRDAELELWPAGRRVRVRDLQAHHEDRSAAAGRMRLALNLAGLPLTDVGRGCELATPGYLAATRCLDAWLTVLRMPGKARRQRVRARLHLATSEVLAEVRLAERASEDPVRDVPAQVISAVPIVAAWNQRFILRDESGSRTLGGGIVLRPVARPWTARRPAQRAGLGALRPPAPADSAADAAAQRAAYRVRAAEVLRDAEWNAPSAGQLAARAGLADAEAARQTGDALLAAKQVVALDGPGGAALVHTDVLAAAAEAVGLRLKEHLRANPRLPGVPRGEWPGWMPRACAARLRPALADWLLAAGHVALNGAHVVPRGHAAAMAPEDQALLDLLLAEFHAAAFQPPGLEGLAARTPKNEKRVRQLVDLAAARGQLVRIADGIWLHGDRWRELCRAASDAIRARGPLTVADVRAMTRSSRKYIVPLLEKLDAAGVTKRSGDMRVLGPRAPAAGGPADAG